jgi:hypothetical protein
LWPNSVNAAEHGALIAKGSKEAGIHFDVFTPAQAATQDAFLAQVRAVINTTSPESEGAESLG